MLSTAGKIMTNSQAMSSYGLLLMDLLDLAKRQNVTSIVRTLDTGKRTNQKRWCIGMERERDRQTDRERVCVWMREREREHEKRGSVISSRLDDDDDIYHEIKND